MTNSFTDDNGNKGTTEQFSTNNGDQTNEGNFDSGSKLQHQIDIMQKRMTDKDSHIKTVESENQTLREEMSKLSARIEAMGSVEAALSRMTDARKGNQDTALDEDTLVSKVLGRMESLTKEERATANFNEVRNTLVKHFGEDKLDDIISKTAQEAGLTMNDMISLAKQSPKAVYKMVGYNTSSSSMNSPSHNTQVGYTSDTQTKEQKLAYYAKLRKENPKEYFKPEVQKAFREVCLSK